MESDLRDPGLRRASGWIKELGFLEHGEKHLLDDFFRLTIIAQNPDRNGEDEAGISVKENFEPAGIITAKTSYCVLVTR